MNRTALNIFGVVLLAASLSAFEASAQQNAGEAVVATVGTKKVTLEEFNRKFNEIKSQTINPPTKAQFLEDIVRYEAGLQEARRRKLDQDPIVIDRMNQELYKGLLEKDIGQRVQKLQVSDAEMKTWYKTNPEIRLSHILIEYKPDATPAQVAEAKKRATEIYDEVRKSKRPFEELVKLYSDDPMTKQAGGDVGWQSRVTILPSYYEAASRMKVGEIKGLIETPLGFHIIKLTGRRSFEESNKRQVRTAVFDEKRKVVFDEYFEKLKKQFPIKVNSSLIK